MQIQVCHLYHLYDLQCFVFWLTINQVEEEHRLVYQPVRTVITKSASKKKKVSRNMFIYITLLISGQRAVEKYKQWDGTINF